MPSKESSRVSFTDSSSKSSSIPAYDSVDVINYFVYVEHENAMARYISCIVHGEYTGGGIG